MKKLLITTLLSLCATVQAQTKWYNPQNADQDLIEGRWWSSELRETYARLPVRAKDSLRPALWDLSRNSAGLSVSFKTNSPMIVVKYTVEGAPSMYHMPATSVSGVDLYSTNSSGQTAWCKSGWPQLSDTLIYKFTGLEYTDNQPHEYKLFLPLYTSVKFMEIGVSKQAEFCFETPKNEKPIVVYGTSIAQGACASRPAMAWTNILQRLLKMPVINLGFSGQGQLDMSMFELLAEIPAKMYIIDCLPNLIRDRVGDVYPRTIAGVNFLRSQTDAPILLAEHSGYMNDITSPEARQAYENSNKELQRAYNKLIASGVKGLYYITKDEIGLSPDSQVDGVHPTDVGMQQYAKAYEKAVREILQ